MAEIPKPDWYDKPCEEWPPAAKEFCRFLYIGMRRAAEAERDSANSTSPVAEREKDEGSV